MTSSGMSITSVAVPDKPPKLVKEIVPDTTLTTELAQTLITKESPTEITLQYSNVVKIGTVSNFGHLRKLDLSFNPLKSLNNIDSFPLLRHLYMYACSITDIDDIKYVPKVEVLLLQQNEIDKIAFGFEKLNKLKKLRLDHNKISEINNLQNCSSLQTLDLSWNSISSLEGIEGLQSLRELKVNHNDLTSLTSLKALPCLVELQVSHNKLKSLNGIQQIPTLQVIWAEGNLITTVKIPQTYAHHQKLRDAAPNSNPKRIGSAATDKTAGSSRGISSAYAADAVCESTSIVGMQKLTEVYLSNNKIDNLNGIDRLGNTLKVFDVSKNNILLLSEESVVEFVASLCHLKNMSQLFLHGNPISGREEVMQSIISQLIANLGDRLESIDNIILHEFNKTEDEKRTDLLNDRGNGCIDDIKATDGAKTKTSTTKDGDDNDDDDDEDYENQGFENTTQRNIHRHAPKLSLKNLYTLEEIEFMEKEFRNLIVESREKMTTIFNLPVNMHTDEIFVDNEALRIDRNLNRASVTLKGILKKNNEENSTFLRESDSLRENHLKISTDIIKNVLKKVYISDPSDVRSTDDLTEDKVRKQPFITADVDYKISSGNLGDDCDTVSVGSRNSARSVAGSEYSSNSKGGETFLIEKLADKTTTMGSSSSTKKNKAIYRSSNSVVASINSLGSGLTRHGSKIVTKSIAAPSAGSSRMYSADNSDTRSEGESVASASSHPSIFASNTLESSSILDVRLDDLSRPLSRIVVLPKYFDNDDGDGGDYARDTSRSSSDSLPSARSESQVESIPSPALAGDDSNSTINGNSYRDRKRAFSGPNLHVLGSVSVGFDVRSSGGGTQSNNNNNNNRENKDEVIAKIAKLLRRTNSEPNKVGIVPNVNDYNISLDDSDDEEDANPVNTGSRKSVADSGDDVENDDIEFYSPRYPTPVQCNGPSAVITARPTPGKAATVLSKSPARFATLNKKGFLEWKVPNLKNDHK